MEGSKKAIFQNPEGRGWLNGDSRRLSNYDNETTFNVSLGKSYFNYYTFLGWLKFQSIEDALEYLEEVGATEGIIHDKEYYCLMKQEGCAFSNIKFYSIK